MDPYRVLGVTPESEAEVVKAAYRALMRKYHPDVWSGDTDIAERKAREITAAYDAVTKGLTQPRAAAPAGPGQGYASSPSFTGNSSVGRGFILILAFVAAYLICRALFPEPLKSLGLLG